MQVAYVHDWVSLCVILHFLTTVENQDLEVALMSADKKELLQMWSQLDGHTQPPCYRLQPRFRLEGLV
jgi:hypothetical protein